MLHDLDRNLRANLVIARGHKRGQLHPVGHNNSQTFLTTITRARQGFLTTTGSRTLLRPDNFSHRKIFLYLRKSGVYPTRSYYIPQRGTLLETNLLLKRGRQFLTGDLSGKLRFLHRGKPTVVCGNRGTFYIPPEPSLWGRQSFPHTPTFIQQEPPISEQGITPPQLYKRAEP